MTTDTRERGWTTGVSRVCADPSLLPDGSAGERRGLLTNFGGTMPDFSRNVDALLDAGIAMAYLFSPEHGLWGSAQAGAAEDGGVDSRTLMPVHDTYLLAGPPLDALLDAAGVDEVLVDLRDFGSRFCTYIWSMFDLMESAARLGIAVVVLDRPTDPRADLRLYDRELWDSGNRGT